MEDAGQWRCVLVDNTQFKSVSRITDLEIGKEAEVSWVGVRNQLSVPENVAEELVCQSVGGYPEPQLTVEGTDNIRPGRPVSPIFFYLNFSLNYKFMTFQNIWQC